MSYAPDQEAPATGFGRMIRLMPIGQRLVVFLGVPLLIFGGIQFMTQLIVTALSGSGGISFLPLLGYVRQWGTASPAATYGVSGADTLHWVIAGTLLVTLIVFVIVLARVAAKRRANPQRRPGIAEDREVQKMMGTKQLVQERGPKLRPSLAGREIHPEQVGYRVGTFFKKMLWCRVEDPMIIIGPSRSGKGFRFLLGWILSAPGAVITTSVRMDNAKLTMRARERSGSRTLIWAPGVQGGKDLGHTMKWDPVDGCLDEETLVRRINALIPAGPFAGSTSNGGHWDSLGRQLASHLFHAAACGERTVDDIWRWVTSPVAAKEAVKLIRNHPEGMEEHADHLEYVITMPDEQRATSWGVLPTVLAFMESRAAREWMKPEEDEKVNLAEFILNRGTLYIVGDKMASPVYVRMNDALLAEIDFITKGLAAASPSSRLDPPVSYILDEAGNIEYQGMYELITAGGGYGRVGVAVFQSKSQLEQFGDASTGATLWDAAVAKIILPGGGDSKALGEVVDLIGEAWVDRESVTVGNGGPSAQHSAELRSIFTKGEVRTLDQDYAFVFYRNLKPVVAKTIPFTEHPQYAECMEDAGAIDGLFLHNSIYAGDISAAKNQDDA